MSEPSALLPCPFCGKPAKPRHGGVIGCKDLDCPGFGLFATANEWNRRASAAPAERAGQVGEPTEGMWGGLARDIMMWMDMYAGSAKTPRNLFLHLDRLGREIPQWLRDEPEMRALDHVPSKGARVVIIYKAMLRAADAERGEK